MSATPPTALEGTHSPSPFDVLWDRYKSLILTIVGAIFLALLGNYAWKYFDQKGIDERWSKFAVSLSIDETYTDQSKAYSNLTEALEDIELATLEQDMASADAAQKPYYLLAIARKAMLEKNWDRAESALAELESGYPEHLLVKRSKAPVQSRDQEETEEDAKPGDEPKWADPKEGSVVSLMRDQIATAKEFTLPESFTKPEIPADALKVKFTVDGYGSFVIAVMPQAPKHLEKFRELAESEWWKGVAVDEIHRSTDTFEQPYSLHFGFASTKDETDRTKWTTTEASEHQVEYETTGLSHFAGAVAGRPGEDGKSCVDRLWISVDDEANLDGTRVVFGYVTEGLDVLRSICDAGMSAQEEERGRGKPEEDIRITAVEIL